MAQAADSPSATLSMPAAPQTFGSRFHISASLAENSNLYKPESVDRHVITELTLIPSFSLSAQNTISIKSIIDHDETSVRNSEISDTSIGLNRTVPLIDGRLSHNYGIKAVVPTNHDSIAVDRLKAAAGIHYKLAWTWKMFEGFYDLSLRRNFHEFKVNAKGNPNIQSQLAHTVDTTVNLSSRWSIELSGIFKQAWTYSDFQHDSFIFESDLNFQMTKAWTLNVGMNTEGSALKASGSGSNLKAFDENTSVIFAGVTFVN